MTARPYPTYNFDNFLNNLACTGISTLLFNVDKVLKVSATSAITYDSSNDFLKTKADWSIAFYCILVYCS